MLTQQTFINPLISGVSLKSIGTHDASIRATTFGKKACLKTNKAEK